MYGEFDDDHSSEENGEFNLEENLDLSLKDRIIDQIAKKSEIIVKSQQRHEPDLIYEERKDIVSELLNNSPSQFLYRFGKHLKREHLQYFNSFSHNIEMKFYLQEAQMQLNEETRRQRMRNRRFGALKKMETSGSYFKEAEMRKRDPLLFDELVDKNMTEEERQKLYQEADTVPINTFSELLLEQIARNVVTDRRKAQESASKECVEEEEDTDGEDEDKEDNKMQEELAPPDEGEKFLMREEFRMTMCAQFVDGKDKDFDYNEVDDEEGNDLLEWEEQDMEEKYFDEEEPETVAAGNKETVEM